MIQKKLCFKSVQMRCRCYQVGLLNLKGEVGDYGPCRRSISVSGPTAKAAVPDLIKAIGQNQNYPERALVVIGKDAVPQLADKLVETLSDTNNPYYFTGIRMAVRTSSGYFIGDRILGVLNQLGTNAEVALPALIQTVMINRQQTYYLREGNWLGGGFYQNPYNVLAHVGQNHPEVVVPILLNEFFNSSLPLTTSAPALSARTRSVLGLTRSKRPNGLLRHESHAVSGWMSPCGPHESNPVARFLSPPSVADANARP